MSVRPRPVTFVNSGDPPGSLRMVGARITDVGCCPATGDRIVDLRGDRLLPGLINAHDHLQLNTLPPLDPARRYDHVSDWIWDVDRRRRTDPMFEALVARPRNARLLVGGVKNLLSGVTTVAHHDPVYPCLSGAEFPVRVVTDFGWSHSLYIDGPEAVRDSYVQTPPDRPWIIHAAEGTSAAAVDEFDQLEELGCIRSNTLLVHGLALDQQRMIRLVRAGAGLVWCPSSNLRLFGATADIDDPAARGRVTLGTDSRLSGGRDLLNELAVARECSKLAESTLQSMVTDGGASLLRLSDRGRLEPGALADLWVLPAGKPLTTARRSDVRLVVISGRGRYADDVYASAIDARVAWDPVEVDGQPRFLDRSVTEALAAADVTEPGLELRGVNWRAA